MMKEDKIEVGEEKHIRMVIKSKCPVPVAYAIQM